MSVQASTFDVPPDLSSFGHEIWWVILVKVVVVFLILAVTIVPVALAQRLTRESGILRTE